ncbi:MAG: guanylate kinase [Ruminococcus sp.]|nr:guanylate kinase [Ruminococcus sp.]
MSSKGLLVVCTGCAGVGKGTVIKQILKNEESFKLSVSATTRSPRPGEQNGREYYFVTKDEFTSMVEQGEFLEHASYVGNFYGTPKRPVEKLLEQGCNVILEIEVQGGVQVKKIYPDCVSIFIAPPSMQVLEDRLRGRGTETEEVIKKRMKTAEGEMEYQSLYDYSVVNDVVERTADEIVSIVKTERDKRK